MPTRAEVHALLTGPGGMFEVVEEVVDGVEMKVFKERMRSLREVHQFGTAMHAAKEYLVHGDERITFEQLGQQANSVAATLRDSYGVGHGDRVAVLSANNPAWVQAFWGTVDLGAILVGLNGWWKAEEIVYGLQDSGSKVLVADRGRFVRIADQLDQCPDLEAVFLIDADPADLGGDPKLHRFDELLQRLDAPWPDTPIDEADAAVIFYTSGTTGKPKGAISTQRSMIANLQNTVFNSAAGAMLAASAEPAAAPAAALPADPAALLTSPLFHVSGCHSGIVVAMLAGIKDVIPVGKFEPEKALELIQREKITIWATVPTMVWRVVEDPRARDFDLSSVTTVAYGGSPVASELSKQVSELFPNVSRSSQANAYGLTESSSVAVLNSGDDYARKPESVGKPVPVCDVRVVRADGTDAPQGEVGEIWLKGPIIMPGYWGKPEATAEAITDGWLHSGDVGYLDDEGFLYITDRAKDMLIRGGENVYCAEIENRLVEHPAIAEAAIIGVEHPTLGEEVKAVVRLEPGHQLTVAELQSWVSETLANFKVPAYVDFTTEYLPRNASGKLLKNVLRGTGEVSFAETM